MPDSEEMTIDERRKYLKRMQRRYLDADKAEKRRLLDEMEAVTELRRWSLARLLAPSVDPRARRPRTRQRGRTYGHDVDDALRVIHESLDYICAERVDPALVATAERLAARGELWLPDALKAQLARISLTTVGRRLAHLRQDEPRLPQRGPDRANQVARAIPMGRIP